MAESGIVGEVPQPSVRDLFTTVMRAVQSIAKTDWNKDQRYSFRGIDAVMNTVGPLVREHGLIVLPVDTSLVSEERYETKSGARMRGVTVCVTWLITGPAGDSMTAQTLGEAADAGDKAVAKAQSVAGRILWLEGLWVPTGEPDPDEQSHERSARTPEQQQPTDPRPALRSEIAKVGRAMGLSDQSVAEQFAKHNDGLWIADPSVEPQRLQAFLDGIRQAAWQQRQQPAGTRQND